ncbi:MAG: hypothetical protein GXP29_06335, partial [Planctomycetes bacterium]|nr:hypothetical protein [Planctomycetota bacterium]
MAGTPSPSHKRPDRNGSRGSKPTLVVLIILPILAAGVAAWLNPPRYHGHCEVESNPVPRGDRDAISTKSFETSRYVFLDTAWSESRRKDRWPTIKLACPSTDRDTDRGTTNPLVGQVALDVTASSRSEVREFLANLGERFSTNMASVKARQQNRLQEETAYLQRQIDQLAPMLVDLAAQMTASSGEDRVDPTDTFRKMWDKLQRLRTRYRGQQMELAETHREHARLIDAPPPATAIVDPAIQKQAYEKHVVLAGDSKQLATHLEQVRQAMERVNQEAQGPLGTIISSLKTIKKNASAPGASQISHEKQTALDRICETAADLNTMATGFSQEWTRGFQQLAEKPIEPMSGDVLDFHEHIAAKASDYNHLAMKALKKLDDRLKSFREAASGGAQG